MDTFMWSLYVDERENVHPAIWDMAAKVETEHGITARHFRKRDLAAEVDRFLEIYNAAWERNWGFVPLTDSEVRHYAKQLKPLLDENWAMVAEKDGEPVGAALTLPDFNQVLQGHERAAAPVRLAQGAVARRKIDRVRVFALGVKKEYQHTGVAAKLYEMHFDSAERTPQKGGEMGWILETNTAHEPRHGGHGRRGHPPLPDLREGLRDRRALRRAAGGRVTMSGPDGRSRPLHARGRRPRRGGRRGDRRRRGPARSSRSPPPAQLPAVQAAAVAADIVRGRRGDGGAGQAPRGQQGGRAAAPAARRTCCRSSARARSSWTCTCSPGTSRRPRRAMLEVRREVTPRLRLPPAPRAAGWTASLRCRGGVLAPPPARRRRAGGRARRPDGADRVLFGAQAERRELRRGGDRPAALRARRRRRPRARSTSASASTR